MTTTAVPPSTLQRRATAGMVGGVLWASWPVAWLVADVRTEVTGTAPSVAVQVLHWLVAVIGPALLVVGHTALRTALGSAAGRVGTTGIVLACLGLAAVASGNAVSLIAVGTGGDSSVAGYVLSYLGFIVALVGALLIGITVLRRRRPAGAERAAGWLLTLAIPLGIGIGVVAAMFDPTDETGFSAAVAVPTGVAWLLLGRSLVLRSGDPARTGR